MTEDGRLVASVLPGSEETGDGPPWHRGERAPCPHPMTYWTIRSRPSESVKRTKVRGFFNTTAWPSIDTAASSPGSRGVSTDKRDLGLLLDGDQRRLGERLFAEFDERGEQEEADREGEIVRVAVGGVGVQDADGNASRTMYATLDAKPAASPQTANSADKPAAALGPACRV